MSEDIDHKCSVDEFVEQSDVFRRDSVKYLYRCCLCEITFTNPDKYSLLKHANHNQLHLYLASRPHLHHLSLEEKKESFAQDQLSQEFDFLSFRDDTPVCIFCTRDLPPNRQSILQHSRTIAHQKAVLDPLDDIPDMPITNKNVTNSFTKQYYVTSLSNKYPELSIYEGELFCKCCKRLFLPAHYHRYEHTVQTHFATKTHAKYSQNPKQAISWSSQEGFLDSVLQDPLDVPSPRCVNEEQAIRACQYVLECGIPFDTLDKLQFYVHLLCGVLVSPKVARTRGLFLMHQKLISERIAYLRDKKLAVIVDETTKGNSIIAGMVIVTLESEPRVFKWALEPLDKADAPSVIQFVHSQLSIIWPDRIAESNVMLFITDGAHTMKASAKQLKSTFPRMNHITCTAHGLQLVSDQIRKLHPELNRFAALFKAIMIKSTKRKSLLIDYMLQFYDTFPRVPFPVIQRWGSWQVFVNFLFFFFNEICDFILNLEPENNEKKLKALQNLIRNKKSIISVQITFIFSNYSRIPEFIAKLEKSNSDLAEVRKLLIVIIEYLRKPISTFDISADTSCLPFYTSFTSDPVADTEDEEDDPDFEAEDYSRSDSDSDSDSSSASSSTRMCSKGLDDPNLKITLAVFAKFMNVVGKNEELPALFERYNEDPDFRHAPATSADCERMFHDLRLSCKSNQPYSVETNMKLVICKEGVLKKKKNRERKGKETYGPDYFARLVREAPEAASSRAAETLTTSIEIVADSEDSSPLPACDTPTHLCTPSAHDSSSPSDQTQSQQSSNKQASNAKSTKPTKKSPSTKATHPRSTNANPAPHSSLASQENIPLGALTKRKAPILNANKTLPQPSSITRVTRSRSRAPNPKAAPLLEKCLNVSHPAPNVTVSAEDMHGEKHQMPKRRGRPPKANKRSPAVAKLQIIPEEVPKKRPRGRPRKVRQELSEI